MELLTQNSKIKKIKDKKTYNFGIPAFKSETGFSTCPNAATCIIGCYANAGAYKFSNVAQVFEKRLKLTQTGQFVVRMLQEIDKKKAIRIRVHDSGDFYNREYLYKWRSIALNRPNVEFYAYTKMVSLVKSIEMPSNFKIIFSFGGIQDKLIDTENDRHAFVFQTLGDLMLAKYADASQNDLVAIGPNKKIGLVYHGTKNYSNTNWSKIKRS